MSDKAIEACRLALRWWTANDPHRPINGIQDCGEHIPPAFVVVARAALAELDKPPRDYPESAEAVRRSGSPPPSPAPAEGAA